MDQWSQFYDLSSCKSFTFDMTVIYNYVTSDETGSDCKLILQSLTITKQSETI